MFAQQSGAGNLIVGAFKPHMLCLWRSDTLSYHLDAGLLLALICDAECMVSQSSEPVCPLSSAGDRGSRLPGAHPAAAGGAAADQSETQRAACAHRAEAAAVPVRASRYHVILTKLY
jgi:hypothetical protein